MDYATLDHVEVEVSEEYDGQASPPVKNSSSQYLSFKLLMSKNSEGRPESTTLVAESRYTFPVLSKTKWLSSYNKETIFFNFFCKLTELNRHISGLK